ncbi:hypothetical protein EOD43_21975 [Sphingomonas crocodyli]|uniref:Uncharacterized protein n=2 Tax=Sphingomonas crocodyli TaxID=1979270 RepID=A0A437LVM9_9SPHN|nr:hypothetical protein EOD43_21975 [Sphingomonas crocodyli]
MMIAEAVTLDSIASRLAAKAGLDWGSLADHPGYLKAIWRERALGTVRAEAPDATIQRIGLDRRTGRIGPMIINLKRMVG